MGPGTSTCEAIVEALAAPGEPAFAGTAVAVDPPAGSLDDDVVAAAVARLASVPCVLAGTAGWESAPPEAMALVDVVVDDGALGAVASTVERAPLAAMALMLHLRQQPPRSAAAGLVAESALYSALQAGPEHRRWRAATPARPLDDDGARVRVTRAGDELIVELARPAKRNALDQRMRDALLDALAVAEAGPAVQVILRGQGPDFCAGGDLDEFGTAPDPATAHLVRLRRSVAAVLARLRDRTTVHLHGACYGAGVELPAFAGRVVARADARLALPELGLGLVPGAGGTVSLPARIGRHRTAWMALTQRPVDAPTALAWGLVDEMA